MSCCPIERAFGYQVTNAATYANGGTAASVVDGSSDGNVYSMIDVTNDTDQDIAVEYNTSDAGKSMFIVPKSVKVKGRRLSSGFIVNSSVRVYSLHNSTVATGNITINVGS